MIYDVNRKLLADSFQVPTAIVDSHIRLANEHQLKVLLWILRNSPENPDIDKMCADLKINCDDAADYLQYWVLTGVLGCNDAAKCVFAASASPAPSVAPAPIKETVAPPPAPSKPSASEIAARLEESPEISTLFAEAQKILGRTIGYDGQCTLLLIHDHYGLPTEVIFTLIGYCVSVNKINYAYIETIGRDWGEREIDTFDKANEQIAALTKANSFWQRFAKMAGISNPRPTTKQTAFIRRWIDEYKFGDDMIFLAYEEMANHTSKLSFGYINKVLQSWHEKGIRTPEDVENAKKARVSKPTTKKTGSESSYSIDEFEKKSVLGSLKYERKKKDGLQ